MKSVLIVYHTTTGGTRQMAQASFEGAASEPAVVARLRVAQDATAADVLDADGCIFATPENLAAMSGMMKDFFDRTYYPVLGQVNGRPYAVLVCAGSDGENAARQIARIATGWRMREMAPPTIVCTHAQTPDLILAPKVIRDADLAVCRDVGAAMAAGLTIGIF